MVDGIKTNKNCCFIVMNMNYHITYKSAVYQKRMEYFNTSAAIYVFIKSIQYVHPRRYFEKGFIIMAITKYIIMAYSNVVKRLKPFYQMI